ncbi:MAG: valine--tRNA ligase [Candidatus Dadabacteria bacterium]|nr:MAG: valine--tRNA ligase [Candidatus Dadabacteria bacterium]
MSSDPTTPLDAAYDHHQIEPPRLQRWLDARVFHAEPDPAREPYCIILPPPNVTGALHMGHALNATLQDILVRYHRMRGYCVLWQPGIDHAGIATQTIVERQLAEEGTNRHELGRETFLERVWQWKEQSGGRIIEQLKRIGASCDWDRVRFTMDEPSSRAVREAFVRLWDEGLIYRGERLINWDPVSHTALSDLEVEYEERDGELWEFAYPVQDSDHEIVVATTRPETMLGDVAVAVHPDDERYRELIGARLRHPFFPEREIIVIADDAVDPEFGTGAVKITPAHDPTDFDIGHRHGLPMINILTLDATINENGGPFQGLDRYAAREEVKARLRELGLERGTEAIRHNVTVSQRSGAVVEPMISRQYFVRTAPLAEAAQKAVQDGQTDILPDSWIKTWNHFLDNIQDWCISRQLWWGHRIPVFYDIQEMERVIREHAAAKRERTEASIALEAGASPAYVLGVALRTLPDDAVRRFSRASTEDLAAQEPDRYIQEADVLDTWFSSALWPFSTLGWPEETQDLDYWYPTSTLITGFDILFFWVARMMMMGVHLMHDVPFRHVVLHAIVRDEHGEKMSKTKGNVIDPLELINDWGADALRFTLAAMTTLGRDISLDRKRIEGYRHFANKIWNACRFVLRSPEPERLNIDPVHPLNRWILSEIREVTQKTIERLDQYQFGAYAQGVYQLIWDRYCDWYIEGAKVLLQDPETADETAATLRVAMDALLRLLHPAMPYVTEELFAALHGDPERLLGLESFVDVDTLPSDEESIGAFGIVAEAIQAVRTIRGENNLPPNQRLSALYEAPEGSPLADPRWTGIIRQLARLDGWAPTTSEAAPAFSGTAAGATFQIWVPLEGLIDVASEIERLEKSLQQTRKELERTQKKLANPSFVERAPQEVVEEQRRRMAETQEILTRTEAQLERLRSLAG